MITPKEIEEKDFTKTFRGYSEDEVDEFLDSIILDLQALQEENAALKADNERLRKENMDHKDSQVSVMHTLDQAKKLMQDISESAEKRADTIIRNAKLDAEMIVKDAKESVYRYGGDGGELREQVAAFRTKFRKMLQEELASFDDKSERFLEEFDGEIVHRSIESSAEAVKEGAKAAASAPEVEANTEEKETLKARSFKEKDLSPEELFAQLEKEVKYASTPVAEFLEEDEGASKETMAISSEEIRKLLQKTDNK